MRSCLRCCPELSGFSIHSKTGASPCERDFETPLFLHLRPASARFGLPRSSGGTPPRNPYRNPFFLPLPSSPEKRFLSCVPSVVVDLHDPPPSWTVERIRLVERQQCFFFVCRSMIQKFLLCACKNKMWMSSRVSSVVIAYHAHIGKRIHRNSGVSTSLLPWILPPEVSIVLSRVNRVDLNVAPRW